MKGGFLVGVIFQPCEFYISYFVSVLQYRNDTLIIRCTLMRFAGNIMM